MEDLNTLQKLIKEILEECPKARNSDKLLIILVYKRTTL